MSRFLLNTDTLQSASENIYKCSQELLDLSEIVSGYSIDADDFDFAGAKNKIADNLNKMNIRVANISQVIGYAADSHSDIQKSLKCSASESLNIKTNNNSNASVNNKPSSSTQSTTSTTPSYKPSTSTSPTTPGYSTPSVETTTPETSPPQGSIIVNQPSPTLPEEKQSFTNYFQQNYPNEYFEGATIAAKGAAPTAIAMILTALKGKEITPIETAKWSVENGYATEEHNTELTYFDAISEAYGIDCKEIELTQENILANISEGKYMIVSMEEGNFGETENYIVITGITEDGKIMIADPNSEDNSTKTWDINIFLDEGTKLWVF